MTRLEQELFNTIKITNEKCSAMLDGYEKILYYFMKHDYPEDHELVTIVSDVLYKVKDIQDKTIEQSNKTLNALMEDFMENQ